MAARRDLKARHVAHSIFGAQMWPCLLTAVVRPYVLIDAKEMSDPIVAAAKVLTFVDENTIETLNVACRGRVDGRQGMALR